jgi:hypothetical protein
VGPLDVLVIECPGDRLKGEIILALTSALDSGMLRIIDVTFIHKDSNGHLSSYELNELDEDELVAYDMVDAVLGLLSVVDIAKVGECVSPDSSAILMVIEHAWTQPLEEAARAVSGRIVLHEHIPPELANAALNYSG